MCKLFFPTASFWKQFFLLPLSDLPLTIYGWLQLFFNSSVVISNKAMHFLCWLTCVAGVKRGRERGNLGARARGACEEEKFPSSLLPRARSRALIHYPFPFERLPRRLTADKRSFSKYEPLQHSNRKICDQKIIDSSLALPLDSVLDNSGYTEQKIWSFGTTKSPAYCCQSSLLLSFFFFFLIIFWLI